MADRVTLKDIALRAGVSTMTVSRALRNQKTISSQTRERIQQISRELNYRPDPRIAELVSRIKRNRKEDSGATLAMIWTDLELRNWNEHFSHDNYPAGIQQRTKELGFKLVDLRVSSDIDDCERVDRILWNRGIRGIIIGGVRPPHQELNLRWDRYAAVALNHTLVNPYIHRVATNHYQTLDMALENLRLLGYRRIGLAMTQTTDKRVNYFWRSTYLGYHSIHTELTPLPFHLPEAYSKKPLIDWIKKHKPDCVLTERREVFQFMKEAGLRIPEQIGYANFVLYPEDTLLSGTIQPYTMIGRASVDMLVDLMHRDQVGPSEYPNLLLLPSRWQEGSTVRAR